MKLPALLTLHGSTRNPFADVAGRGNDPDAARMLAIAVVTAHDSEQIFAILRGLSLAYERPSPYAYLTGRLMLDHNGEEIDRELLAPYASEYLGRDVEPRDVAYIVDRFPGFVAVIGGAL